MTLLLGTTSARSSEQHRPSVGPDVLFVVADGVYDLVGCIEHLDDATFVAQADRIGTRISKRHPQRAARVHRASKGLGTPLGVTQLPTSQLQGDIAPVEERDRLLTLFWIVRVDQWERR